MISQYGLATSLRVQPRWVGFIHIGKQLSFVYDTADLYKADLTIPLIFRAAVNPAPDLLNNTCA